MNKWQCACKSSPPIPEPLASGWKNCDNSYTSAGCLQKLKQEVAHWLMFGLWHSETWWHTVNCKSSKPFLQVKLPDTEVMHFSYRSGTMAQNSVQQLWICSWSYRLWCSKTPWLHLPRCTVWHQMTCTSPYSHYTALSFHESVYSPWCNFDSKSVSAGRLWVKRGSPWHD